MYKLVVMVCALTAAAFAAPGTRIVGGTPTTIEEFPYVAAFLYTYPGPGITVQRCVGGILSSWHILTTGFCFTGANLENMKVRAGSTNSMLGGEEREIQNFVKHPGYVEDPRADDLAVVSIRSPLFLSNVINTLFLPPQNTFIEDYSSVKIVSWGFESEQGPQLDLLKTVNLLKIPLLDCQQRFSDVSEVLIEDPVICAGDQGILGMCLGDSGAPMVMGQVIVGISSFFKGCGDPTYPDVFTRIDRYTSWILEVAAAPSGQDLRIGNATVVATPMVR